MIGYGSITITSILDAAAFSSDNLLLDTTAPSLEKVNGPDDRYFSDAGNSSTTGEFIEEADLPDPGATHFVRITITEAGKYRALCFYNGNIKPPIIVGETYRLSCYARAHSGAPVLRFVIGAVEQHSEIIPVTSAWKRYEWTFTLKEYTGTSGTYRSVYFYNRDSIGALDMCGFRLEHVTDDAAYAAAQNELILGTQTSSTHLWTGTSGKIKALVDGQQITYWLPYAGNSTEATLELTLADGTSTGPVPVYYRGSTRAKMHFVAGTAIHLTYRVDANVSGTQYTGWWADASYDSGNTNYYDRVRYQQAIKAGSTAIVAKNIIVAGAGNAGTYTHLKLGNPFDITYPILFANGGIAVGKTGTDNYLVLAVAIATTQAMTLVAYKSVYIKGILDGSTFTPVSTTPLTQEIPTTEDGYQYILLGTAYSTTNMYLLPEHPVFMYYNGAFKSTQQIAAEAALAAAAANRSISTIETELETLDGEIAARVKKTDYNADQLAVAERISQAEAKITDEAIIQTVSGTYVTNANYTGNAAGGLFWKVNYSTYSGSNAGECYFHGLDDSGNPADVDGWVRWNGGKVVIPKGMNINPNNVAPYNVLIYHVYRTSNTTFYDVWYDEASSCWKGYAYNSSHIPGTAATFSWVEKTDIILASYVEPSSEGSIHSGQLYTPPKKASEITQLAEAIAQLKITENEIKSTVSETYTTKQEFSSLEVGGENLLRGTADFLNAALSSTLTVSDDTDDEDGIKVCTFPAAATLGWYSFYFKPRIPFSLVRGKKVTLSFWYRSNSWTTASGEQARPIPSFDLYTDKSTGSRYKWFSVYDSTISPPAETWQRASITYTLYDDLFISGSGTISDSDFISVSIFRYNNSHLQVKKVKLEYGDKATSWSPSPADMAARMLTAESSITQNTNDINLKVSQTDYNGNTIMGMLNLSSTTAKLAVPHINFSGKTFDLTSENIAINSTYFSVTKNGKVTCTSGDIGGWAISSSGLSKYTNYTVGTPTNTAYWIALRGENQLTPQGHVIDLGSCSYDGSTFSNWSSAFYVQRNGYVGAVGGGKIGAWNLQTAAAGGALYNTKSSYADTANNGVYLGSDGIALGKNGFKVSSAGQVTITDGFLNIAATNAERDHVTMTYGEYTSRLAPAFLQFKRTNGITGTMYVNSLNFANPSGTYKAQIGIFDTSSYEGKVIIDTVQSRVNGGTVTGFGRIEMYPASTSTGNGGYIDFHYNQSSSDYTGRLIGSSNAVVAYPSISNGSDRRLKNTFGTLGKKHAGLLKALMPVEYEYKHFPGSHHYGFIAQDVLKVCKALGVDCSGLIDVTRLEAPADGAEYYTLNYLDLIAILVAGWQEHEQRINQMAAAAV